MAAGSQQRLQSRRAGGQTQRRLQRRPAALQDVQHQRIVIGRPRHLPLFLSLPLLLHLQPQHGG